MKDICSKFGQNVKYFRRKLNYSQEILAEKSGLHRTYISDVERGQRSISLNNIGKIANALEVDIYKLFIFEEEYDNGKSQ